LSLEVTAIDISSNAIQASLRGIKDARVQDVMTLENETRHDFTIDEWW
jgi:hypothetical protein